VPPLSAMTGFRLISTSSFPNADREDRLGTD